MRSCFFCCLIALMIGLASVGLHAQSPHPQSPHPHAAYWDKYGDMPPLDIRVSLNGNPVLGLFEWAQAESQGKKHIPLDSLTIPLVTGQRVSFKGEVSKRDANQWFDVTQHPNLILTNVTGGVQIDKRTKQITVLGDAKYPHTDFGYASIGVYYTDMNPADEQAGYTRLYLDIKRKP